MDHRGHTLKKACLWGMIVVSFLLAGYLCLLAVLSIWIGVRSAPQPGCWVPILAGSFCFFPIIWALFRVTRLLRSQMAEKGIVRF
jgi:uncharacterized membrane protein HdeD (DUF308 family)